MGRLRGAARQFARPNVHTPRGVLEPWRLERRSRALPTHMVNRESARQILTSVRKKLACIFYVGCLMCPAPLFSATYSSTRRRRWVDAAETAELGGLRRRGAHRPGELLMLSTVAQTSSPRHSPGRPDLKPSPHPTRVLSHPLLLGTQGGVGSRSSLLLKHVGYGWKPPSPWPAGSEDQFQTGVTGKLT